MQKMVEVVEREVLTPLRLHPLAVVQLTVEVVEVRVVVTRLRQQPL